MLALQFLCTHFRITVGTKCKNGGCKGEYEGPQSNSEDCIHHPGVPVFHEGLKYWSCCQKKTTDFSTFLNQAGCSTGLHKWKNEVLIFYIIKIYMYSIRHIICCPL